MAPAATLPPLREELGLYPGPHSQNGAPTWTIHDPTTNRFFRIGWEEFEMLARWHLGTPEAIVTDMALRTTLQVTSLGVMDLVQKLASGGLLQVTGDAAALAQLVQKAQSARKRGWKRLLSAYIFVRIPLWRPDRFLESTLPWIQWIFTRSFLVLAGMIVVAALVTLLRQWELFVSTLGHHLTPDSIGPVTLSLLLTKTLHELAHAYTAKQFGCRIPVMGIALLVMWPVPFTQTSEVWKLSSRRQRLAVGAAGMIAELLLAAIAILAWERLPVGFWRDGAFFLGMTSWIISLVMNLNPLTRFDGYHLLANALEFPNLQDRAFAMGRWALREWLFNLHDPAPESLSPGKKRFLILYAWAAWIYRLVLFFGIALLVYHYFFKLLGVILFVVEIGWFLLYPMLHEIRFWWRRHRQMGVNRTTMGSVVLLCLLIVYVCFPREGVVRVAALMRPVNHTTLYAPSAVQLVDRLPELGSRVERGEILATLFSPELEQQQAHLESERALLAWRLSTLGMGENAREQEQELQRQQATFQAALQAIQEEKTRLTLTAPFAGMITKRLEGATPGSWLKANEALLSLSDLSRLFVEAYIPGDLPSLPVQAEAVFFPDDLDQPSVPCRMTRVSRVNVRQLTEPYLASLFDGPILVRKEQDGTLVPEESLFQAIFLPAQPVSALPRLLRGQMHIKTAPENLVSRFWRWIGVVFIQESGF